MISSSVFPTVLAATIWILQVDVDAPGPQSTPGQRALAWGLVAVLLAIVVAVRLRNRYAGLDGDESSHKSVLAGSKRDQTPRVLRIPASADPAKYRSDLRALFVTRFDDGPDLDHEPIRLLDATRSIRSSFLEAWRPVTDRFSSMVLRLTSLAWVAAILGAVAVATDSVVRLILVDTSIGSPESVLSRTIELTTDVLEAGATVLTAFPYLGELWAFVFALVTLLFEYLYREWYLIPIALLLAAISIAYLERQVSDELETKLYESRRRLLAFWIGAISLVWIAGVVPASIGSYLFVPDLGAIVGFVLALLTAAALAVVGARRYVDRLRSTATLARDESRTVLGYLVARRAGISAAIPATILSIAWGVVIVAEGKAARVWDAFVASDIGIKVLAAALLVGVVVVLAYMVRDAWPDVRSALAESLARSQVRAAVLYRGSIVVGFGAGYLIAFAFTRDVLVGLVLAAIGAVTAFGLYQLLERAKYRLDVWERDEDPPKTVTIQGWQLRDADGDRHPYAVINGRHELAREDPDDLVDEIMAAIAEIQTGDGVDPSLASKHAETLLEIGQVDEQTTLDRLDEQARKRLVDELRPLRSVTDRDDVERALRDVPDRFWQDWLDELDSDVVVDHGETLELVRDPWSTA